MKETYKMDYTKIKTLGELEKIGYQHKTIKEELRANLIDKLRKKEKIFEGILGFDFTVIPEIERAILSKHNIILLGLRGQAKTRIARLMVQLLDEYIPYIEGSEIYDDPFKPISKWAKDVLVKHGAETRISWLHRAERYAEKLATPDVTVADLIGDVDPIKAATLKLTYADDRVIHYGMIPRSNRCIFVINELPDLQARIQVSLFNILQEGDVQIRGFKLRLPLDIQFIFTANPEDYTNRGSIVTPLKDRIESQILTHYPKEIGISKAITLQEAKLAEEQKKRVSYSDIIVTINEMIAFEARNSEFVDSKSGVSARLTISAFESLISAAERRAIINNEKITSVRIADFYAVIPAITGKIELVYEGEQEGPAIVAHKLISNTLRKIFKDYYTDPDKLKKKKGNSPYQKIVDWFAAGNSIDLLNETTNIQYEKLLKSIDGLEETTKEFLPDLDKKELLLMMELMLFGLAEYSQLSRNILEAKITFGDLFSSMFSSNLDFDEEELNN